jgi:hypothetical protein
MIIMKDEGAESGRKGRKIKGEEIQNKERILTELVGIAVMF